MAKEKESKIELERTYVIPLRLKCLKVPRYRRVPRAIKTIKKFLARHMKVEDRDENKVKIDRFLNEEVWFRGIKKPMSKIKVKAVKKDGIVTAELAEVPAIVKFRMDREKRIKEKVRKVPVKKEEEKEEKKEERTEQQKTEEKEKEISTAEAGMAKQKQQAKQTRHIAKDKVGPKHQFRMALEK